MDIEQIKKDWLLGVESSYSDEEILKGFSTLLSKISPNFIDDKWKGQKGIAVANQIVQLGLNVDIVKGINGFEKLKERLLNPSTYNIAVSELACSVPFGQKGLLVELYPLNPDKNGELEMKLEIPQVGAVYVEVVSPRTQIWDTFLMKTVNQIKEIAKRVISGIRLEIYAYEILSRGDLEYLYKECQKITSGGKVDTEILVKDKFHIFLNKSDVSKINSAERKTEEQTSLFATNLAFGNVITLGVPFADKRAEQVLEGEYHQLTTNFPNIIVMDLSGVPKGMDNWPTYIKRRLQPKINRKISAVMLKSSVNAKRIEDKNIWIVNPYAHHALDKGVLESIE